MAPRLSQRTQKVKQIAILHVKLVNQCLELAVIQAAGEDDVDDLYHNRHYASNFILHINKYVRFDENTQSLLGYTDIAIYDMFN